MPGVSQGGHRSGATQPGDQVATTSPTYPSVAIRMTSGSAPGRNSGDVLEDGVDVGSPCIPHRGLAEIVALELRYDGGKGKDFELSSHEGFTARSREIG